MFEVGYRYLAEHMDVLNQTRNKLVRYSGELESSMQTLSSLGGMRYPIDRLKALREDLDTAATQINRFKDATERIASEYSNTERKIDEEIEEVQWRLRNRLQNQSSSDAKASNF